MPSGTILPVSGTDICIKRDGESGDYSSGSTCLVYRGHILFGSSTVTDLPVIIKEFYPISKDTIFNIKRQPDGSLRTTLRTQQNGVYRVFCEQFRQGYEYQKELAGSNAMEISVRPMFYFKWGDTMYIISDAHRGTPAEKTRRTLRDTLSFSVSFAETMAILHDSGYIMTDIKANNFLWIQKPHSIRIIDSDSLVPYRDPERLARQPLFANKNHWSPELRFLNIKMREGTSDFEMSRLRRLKLNPNADRYSMGIFLFELFFGRLPAFKEQDACFGSRCLDPAEGKRIEDFQSPIDELTALYGTEIAAAGCSATQFSKQILEILRRLLIYSPQLRRKNGYQNDYDILSDLQTLYTQLTSEKLVLRRETAKANARFAAYNLLQKFPLFEYPAGDPAAPHRTIPNSLRAPELQTINPQELRVAIIGQHAMRSDMLSAVLSIGQMPDLPLHIDLISKDAEVFWQDYISAACNPALARAVTWEILEQDPQMIIQTPPTPTPQTLIEEPRNPDSFTTDIIPCFPGNGSAEFDPSLVDRPLAHLTIRTQEAPSMSNHLSLANYYILLEEDPDKRLSWIRHISRLASRGDRNIFIGHLQFENDVEPALSEKDIRTATLYSICTESFTENYSEKMFSEKIYEMGLMAHAYYCKAMDASPDGVPSIDMKSLEEQYRGDVYSITSSERCALHGAYKLAGLGIDRKLPGRVRQYFRQISRPDVLEELAWIEHLSWTAFMLTSGAVPVSMEEFNTYAYLGGNDWKDKSDPRHLRHPLLASSVRSSAHTLQELKKTEDVGQEIFDCLDPLDKVSVQIARWYEAHRDLYRKRYLEWFTQLYDLCTSRDVCRQPESLTTAGDKIISSDLLSMLRNSGLACIERMGTSLKGQDPLFRRTWEDTVCRIRSQLGDVPATLPEPKTEKYPRKEIRESIEDMIKKCQEEIMKPIFDSLDDRDFKQYDRDLAYAVIDIIA